VKHSYGSRGFAVDGEEVWAVPTDGVVHWDGQRWQFYPEMAVSAIAAPTAPLGPSIRFGGGKWKNLGGWMAEAIPKSPALHGPGYCRTGMAIRAMGSEEAADGYLKQSQDLDPHGRGSALATAA